MNSRKFRLAMTAFIAVWFGVVLPGHERGVITVPGSSANESCSSCEHDSQCGVDSNAGSADGKGQSLPGDDPASHCAICKFIGTLDLPPLAMLTTPISEQVAVLNWAAPRVVHVVEPLEQTNGRAPPHFA